MSTMPSTFGGIPPQPRVWDMTHVVYCHVCPHGEDAHPRNRSRMIGSASWGGLWHCEKHQHGHERCKCPHGNWTEPADWWKGERP